MVNQINNATFDNLINYLLKKWLVFLIVGMIAGVLGLIYAGLQKPKYESKLTFVLEEGETGVSGAAGLAAQFGLDLGGGNDAFSGDNILQIIKSRRVIEKVFLSVDTFENKTYSLAEYYWEKEKGKGEKDTINFPVGITEIDLSPSQKAMLFKIYSKFLASNLSAQRPDRRLGIYEVNVTSTDEKFSKIFTDRLLAETNNFYIENCTKKARITLEAMEKRVAAIKDSLGASISGKARIQDFNLNAAFSSAQVPVLRKQTNVQVYGAAYGEMYKNLELARYQYLKQVPLVQIIDDAKYPMNKIRVGKLATGFWFAYMGDFLLLIFLLTSKTFLYIRNIKTNKISP